MNSKHLTIGVAIVTAIAVFAMVEPALAQAAAAAPAAPAENPYGIEDIIKRHNPVQMGILVVLAIMSIGTWYISVMKYLEQRRILNHAKTLEKKFWSSATLNEGIDKLPKDSVFRAVAEAGLKASQGGTALVGLNDWIGMSLTRQLEDANSRMQGGVAFLA